MSSHQKLKLIKKTRKGVPELRGPALVCLSAIDKKQRIGSPHGPESYMSRI